MAVGARGCALGPQAAGGRRRRSAVGACHSDDGRSLPRIRPGRIIFYCFVLYGIAIIYKGFFSILCITYVTRLIYQLCHSYVLEMKEVFPI